jgi:multiple sugar transport system substrate-binding protein
MNGKRKGRKLTRRAALAAGGLGLLGAGFGAGALAFRDREPARREWEAVGDRPLRLLASRDDTANGQRRLLIDQWNAWHPDHSAEMVELPPIVDLQYSTIHAALQAEDAGVDLVEIDVPWIAEFAAAGRLEPFTDPDTRGFLKRPLEAGRYDGAYYALPFHTNVGMLYYRKGSESDYDHGVLTEKEAASITSWGDLRDTIGGILRRNDEFDAGIAMQLASYEGFTVNVWEYLLANGIVTRPDGWIDFGSEDAHGLLRDLAEDLHGEIAPGTSVILPDALQHNEDESLAAFQEGRTPFLRHWPQVLRTLEQCDAIAAAGPVEFKVGMVPMPGGVLGGGSLAVSAYSERKHVSRALIEFLTGPTSQQLLFERGGFAATRPEPYFDAIAQIDDLAAQDDGAADCESTGGPRREAGPMYEALTGEGPGRRPAVRRYTQFSRAFRDELHPLLGKDSAPDFTGLESRLERAVEGK